MKRWQANWIRCGNHCCMISTVLLAMAMMIKCHQWNFTTQKRRRRHPRRHQSNQIMHSCCVLYWLRSPSVSVYCAYYIRRFVVFSFVDNRLCLKTEKCLIEITKRAEKKESKKAIVTVNWNAIWLWNKSEWKQTQEENIEVWIIIYTPFASRRAIYFFWLFVSS